MFNPSHFADLAVTLPNLDDQDRECCNRSAYGRAYYALFLAVRAAIRRAQNKDVDEEIGHGYLASTLTSSPNDKIASVGVLLAKLYDARMNADYKLDPKNRWRIDLAKGLEAERLAKAARDQIQALSAVDFTSVLADF
jgi:hypothetical protein